MVEPKTKPTDQPVGDFINTLPDEQTRQDCRKIVEIMQEVSKTPAVVWGTSIVGFGTYSIAGSNGKTTEWPLIGFSPRKQALTLYLSLGGFPQSEKLLARLGKHSLGKGCLYIKHLSDVDIPTLTELVKNAYAYAVKTKL
jgi:hypothetical protein